MAQQQNSQMQECIKLCWECRDVCQDTLYNHILERDGDHIDSQNIKALTDCIQACQTAADLMRRNSPTHASVCSACADVCEACAESCEAMGKEHITIQRCADICRRCAQSCSEMGKMKKAA